MASDRRHKSRERHEILRGMLEARRREIQDKLRHLRETLPSEITEVKDAEEQSVHDFVQDIELALIEMKSETLAKIDEALKRLEAGGYGTCAECGREISEARLRAVPFADLCLVCQQQAESRDRGPDRGYVREFEPLLR